LGNLIKKQPARKKQQFPIKSTKYRMQTIHLKHTFFGAIAALSNKYRPRTRFDFDGIVKKLISRLQRQVTNSEQRITLFGEINFH